GDRIKQAVHSPAPGNQVRAGSRGEGNQPWVQTTFGFKCRWAAASVNLKPENLLKFCDCHV
ncbi:MAG: hypothetical protein R3350_07520, partial [Saprospiraceae bacterium]|nr:hypothetical protein [Saprospiraceae bacterium]